MKKFRENELTDFEELNDVRVNSEKEEEEINLDKMVESKNEDIHVNKVSEPKEENLYKRFDEEKEEKDDYITPSMKRFRTSIGIICLVLAVTVGIFHKKVNESYRDNLTSGYLENVNAGDILSKEALKLDAKDESIEVANGYGNLEISIWNFSKVEDNDYVQVFIDGVAQGGPFSIRHKPIKISVPDKAVIQVQGVRDGGNNGITYAVHFNKTGETYLNTVSLNAKNSYTIVSR